MEGNEEVRGIERKAKGISKRNRSRIEKNLKKKRNKKR